MKKKFLVVLLGLIVLLVFMLTMAPASTIISIVQDKLPKNLKALKFSNVTGTIWSPQIASISYEKHRIQNLNLDINPLNLMLGDLDIDLSVKDPNLVLEGELIANSETLNLKDLNFDINASALDPFMQFPVKGLAGLFQGTVKIASFNTNGAWKNLAGQGLWKDAVVYYMNSSLPLGKIDYVVKTDSENNLIFEIIDNDNAIDTQGSLRISPNKQYHLDLTTSNQLPEGIEVWVKQLGRLENNRYRIQWNGQLN